MLPQIGVALSASPEEAARRLREAGADYLILCGADPELGMVRASPEEEPLLLRVARGEVAIPGYPTILETDEVLVLGAARLR
jgi:hypothetical protein